MLRDETIMYKIGSLAQLATILGYSDEEWHSTTQQLFEEFGDQSPIQSVVPVFYPEVL